MEPTSKNTQFQQAMAAHYKGDYAQAFKLLKPVAEQGEAIAQYYLGLMYRDGQGTTKSYTQAMIWFQKAADQNYAEAQYDLGNMYFTGRGVNQDTEQAFEWYQKAANQGLAMLNTL